MGLHGAMVAHGYDDTEGDVIGRVRALVGPKCVIGVELDRLADIIVLYKEFPHTEVVARAEDPLTLVSRTIRGEIHPVMSLHDCRRIGSYPPTLPLMRVRRQNRRDGGQGWHYRKIPYTRVRRPIWPLDAETTPGLIA